MQLPDTMGMRRFGSVNWIGFHALYAREVRRFASIYTQTVLAPAVTSGLFMLVFVLAFGGRRGDVAGIGFAAFLAPGLLMMSVIQNAFANSSSSIIVAKIQGNIIDTLMPPLSPGEMLAGYALGGATRGIVCAVVTGVLIFPFAKVGLAHPIWAAVFVLSGSLMLALVGVLAGIYSDKFDQMAAITNFVITPLSFLSGTFYSIKALPEPFLVLSHINPFFYLIDGFRYGAAGVSDADPVLGLTVIVALNIVLATVGWHWLRGGYRLKT
ncbi:MAG: ABC transporter permease [Desulfobacterales bacterium]|nr:ABC transporter permease [Desulfobacterales bacterium]